MRIHNSQMLFTELSHREKNELRLLAAGGSFEKVSPKTFSERMLSVRQWLQNSWDRSERIHRQIQIRKEEIMLQQIRSGLPPRFF